MHNCSWCGSVGCTEDEEQRIKETLQSTFKDKGPISDHLKGIFKAIKKCIDTSAKIKQKCNTCEKSNQFNNSWLLCIEFIF